MGPHERSRSVTVAMRWWACLSGAALSICALSLGMLFTRRTPESYDAQIMFQVTQSMVDHGNFFVHQDPFGINTPYSYYGIGMSLLMALPYWVAERLHQDPGYSWSARSTWSGHASRTATGWSCRGSSMRHDAASCRPRTRCGSPCGGSRAATRSTPAS